MEYSKNNIFYCCTYYNLLIHETAITLKTIGVYTKRMKVLSKDADFSVTFTLKYCKFIIK